jgi:dehydrogenase/reductase SDR family protein 7B
MKDKVVIITGGTSGIGKAIAIAFAKLGGRVVISGRNPVGLAETEIELKKYTNDVLAVQADVSLENDCVRLINETLNRFGAIDILINNAGISMRALFSELNLDVLRKVMDTNFWGTVYCSKYAMGPLLKSRGVVVGISSIAGIKGLPARSGYSASKFAMNGFLEALRIENLKTGVHVLTCCPGFTASNIRNTALAKDGNMQGESPRDEKKMMQPEEVAEALIKAIRQRKRTLLLTRQGKLTNFINKFFPGWLDKKVYDLLAKEPDSPLK